MRLFRYKLKLDLGSFPSGPLVKNPPANAGDTQFQSLVWADSTCLRETKPLSPWATTPEPPCPGTHPLQQEKSPQ